MAASSVFAFGPFHYDAETLAVPAGEVFRWCPRQSTRCTCCSSGAAGRGKAELMKLVWPDTRRGCRPRAHISLLRKALDDESGQYIETIRGWIRFAAEAQGPGSGRGQGNDGGSRCWRPPRGAGRIVYCSSMCRRDTAARRGSPAGGGPVRVADLRAGSVRVLRAYDLLVADLSKLDRSR